MKVEQLVDKMAEKSVAWMVVEMVGMMVVQ